MIVGGITRTPNSGKLWLADVWEFHFEQCCWVQVTPSYDQSCQSWEPLNGGHDVRCLQIDFRHLFDTC